ncbi:hypothetical protein KAR91_38260 [Candidatus Pacearchaeota archaeon]|nr:hypothetical protein [Candidatus Pacearchaeota archaeon]
MKKIYLIGAIIVFLLILVLAMPQIGSTCVWYLINPNSNPTLVLFQTAGLGAIMGGFLVLFWKAGKEEASDDDDDDDSPAV